ncbi:MAG: glycosyltransferase family 2 protein [Planctomycetota bacterium]
MSTTQTSSDSGTALRAASESEASVPPAVSPADAAPPAPALSFGVPVRNGQRFLPRLLDSLLAQDLTDFEVVICDNESTDDTPEICASYAARDPRIRYLPNAHNIGQIENFNRTLELARGRYFRWIGVDDWLEPSYARRCVEVLERVPEAVGITTFQDHIDDEGHRLYAEYRGERLDSPDLARRFGRMMWAFTADYRFFDPIYSMMRRDVLERSRRLRFVPNTDQVLAAELIAFGPFLHVDECLAHRRKEYLDFEGEEVYRRYAPGRHGDLEPTTPRLLRLFMGAPWYVETTLLQRVRCVWPVLRHCAISSFWRNLWRARRLAGPLRPVLRPVVRGLRRAAKLLRG